MSLAASWKAVTNWLHTMRARIAKIARSSIYATIVTLLILFTGAFGSLYSQEIKSAFPFHLVFSRYIAWKACIFWLLVGLSAFLFFVRQRAVEESRKEAERELIRIVRTQPPADFLAFFAVLFDECQKLVDESLAPNSDKQFEFLTASIRQVLRSFAILTQEFHERTQNCTYGANLMRFISAEDAASMEEELRRRLRFCEEEVALASLSGVLDLELELSTTSASPNAEPDSSLFALALPVPKTERDKVRRLGESEPRWRVLPGAPLAFFSGKAEGFEDTKNVSEWMRQRGDFTEQVTDAVEEYFLSAEEPTVRSFLSLPLLRPGGERTPWVVNLHCEEPGLFRDRLRDQFVPLVRPLQALLLQLVEEWRNMQGCKSVL